MGPPDHARHKIEAGCRGTNLLFSAEPTGFREIPYPKFENRLVSGPLAQDRCSGPAKLTISSTASMSVEEETDRSNRPLRHAARIAPVPCGALALIVLVFALGAAPAAAAPHGCRDVMFIGARVSGEPLQVKKNGRMVTVFHGVGEPLEYMATQLETDGRNYGETMGILPVIYPADSTAELIPSCWRRRRERRTSVPRN